MRDLIDSDESDCKAIARAFWHFQAIWIGGRSCRYPSVIAASGSHSMNALQAPGEVRVRHDGSASIGKLSAQNVGRTVVTARHVARESLAKMPYVPVPVRMKVSEHDEIQFWWSYVVPYLDARWGFFDYWGHALGDLRFLWKTLRPGMVFLNVGAHHGVYSIVAAKKTGPPWHGRRL